MTSEKTHVGLWITVVLNSFCLMLKHHLWCRVIQFILKTIVIDLLQKISCRFVVSNRRLICKECFVLPWLPSREFVAWLTIMIVITSWNMNGTYLCLFTFANIACLFSYQKGDSAPSGTFSYSLRIFLYVLKDISWLIINL